MITLSGNTDGNHFAADAEDYVDNIVLAAGVAKPYVTPAGAKYLFFTGSKPFLARFSSDAVVNAAAVPVGDVTDGTGVVISPIARKMTDGLREVSLISSEDCIISITPAR